MPLGFTNNNHWIGRAHTWNVSCQLLCSLYQCNGTFCNKQSGNKNSDYIKKNTNTCEQKITFQLKNNFASLFHKALNFFVSFFPLNRELALEE